MFDAEKYFESKGIEYHLPPEKNVTKGWVNIPCPFPGCADPSWHCGVSLEKEKFNCYKCKNRGHVARLVQELEQCSRKKAWSIFKSFSGSSGGSGLRHHRFPPLSRPNNTASTKRLDFPKLASKDFPRSYLTYLLNRGFDPDALIAKYDLYAGGRIGDYNHRIIIPIYYKRNMVSFTSRDITGLSDIPYIHSGINKSIIDPKRLIYNYDNVKIGKTIIVVEGVFDVWRIGEGAVCIFGTEYTWEQIEMILDKEPIRIIILFDADAADKGRSLANQFSGIGIKDVKNFIIDRDDPDKLDKADLVRIRKMIL